MLVAKYAPGAEVSVGKNDAFAVVQRFESLEGEHGYRVQYEGACSLCCGRSARLCGCGCGHPFGHRWGYRLRLCRRGKRGCDSLGRQRLWVAHMPHWRRSTTIRFARLLRLHR